MIDLFASRPHYARHLAPIWSELAGTGLRGRAWSPVETAWGSEATAVFHRGRSPVLVASHTDYNMVAPRPVIFVEHGAGQTYGADRRGGGHPSYPGGRGLGRVVLFVCPSERVAAAWRARYSAPAVPVGCPALDDAHRAAQAPERGTVAWTWHWDCRLVPESLSALDHYRPAMASIVEELARAGVTLLGHGHPRNQHAAQLWHDLGVRWAQIGQVMDEAAVLVADNTSVAYEFASLDRPVVVLNAPWYRRDVEHGLRFWSHPPGVQVDQPDQVVAAVLEAAVDPTVGASLRRAATAEVYAATDGSASRRAVEAILATLEVSHAEPLRTGPVGHAR